MASLEVQLSQLDLNAGVDFREATFRFYLNVPEPLGETRAFAEASVPVLEPRTAAAVRCAALLPVTASQLALVDAGAQLGPGARDVPSLVVHMLHLTHNMVGQECSTEQGVAVVPLRAGLGNSTLAAFHTTYELYNEESTSIRTARGVPASASVAAVVTLRLRRHGASGTRGAARTPPSPRICYPTPQPRAEVLHAGSPSGRTVHETVVDYHRPVGRLRPLRRNLEVVNFATYACNGCTLPGWAFQQCLEPQVVQDAAIEQAVLVAALGLRPAETRTLEEAAAALAAYLASDFARAHPTALFHAALQLPAVSLPYLGDETEVPREFSGHDMTTDVDSHVFGLTDTYTKAEVTSARSYDRATASVDCEDRSDLTSDDMAINAMAYVLSHYDDPEGSLSRLVARGLAPLLHYVTGSGHCSLDHQSRDSHMVGLAVRRDLLPPVFHRTPWGAVPWQTEGDARTLPPAIYMDATFYTPQVPITARGTEAYGQLFNAIVRRDGIVENLVNATDLVFSRPDSPVSQFVLGRFFVDARLLQGARTARDYRSRAWLKPAFSPHTAATICPMFVPTDRRRPGTYGLSLVDLCTKGATCAAFVPHIVPLRTWQETLLMLAWRHPPVPIKMEADRSIVCRRVRGEARAGHSPDLVLPLVMRNASYTPGVHESLLATAARVWAGTEAAGHSAWQLDATLSDLCGKVEQLTFVV